ncbi:hypothetical protein IEQ34_022856 [Dendrobium chrysotoxum]|uniref:Uncharacterized protein n=1 Tax=Dendrobium chrysotoxum TaxID=161865 RepID=A0AAV7FYA5_DENCH|nr:hypothetical protein IEQ34_022856 [Dendrobium chrysotoxum]
MASKTSGLRKKRVATYDKFKFISKAAMSRFTELIVSKSLIPEHGFLNPTQPIIQTIYARGWVHFYEEPFATIINLVKVAYDFKCYVRGRCVPFHSSIINRVHKV